MKKLKQGSSGKMMIFKIGAMLSSIICCVLNLVDI